MCRQIYTYLAFKYILVYATNIEHREIKMWFPWWELQLQGVQEQQEHDGDRRPKNLNSYFFCYPRIAPLGVAFGFGAEKGIEVNHYWCNI